MYHPSHYNRLGMIRLPTHLRSFLLTKSIANRRSHTALAPEVDHKKLFDLVASTPHQSKKHTPPRPSGHRKQSKEPNSHPSLETHHAANPPLSETKEANPVLLDKQLLKDEGEAKEEVYDYAASQGLIPQFDVVFQDSASKKRGRGRKFIQVVQVIIKLPEQGIEASAIAPSFKVAEIAAAIDFKRQAEQYQSRQVDNTSSPNDFNLLTQATVKSFYDYLKIAHRGTNYTIESETIGSQQWLTYHKVWVVAKGEPVGPKVSMSKKNGENLAWLTAAVEIVKKDPQLLVGFRQAMAEGNGKVLMPMAPVDLQVHAATLNIMHNVLRNVHSIGLPQVKEYYKPGEAPQDLRRYTKPTLSYDQVDRISQNLARRLKHYEWNPRLETLRNAKNALPMNQYRDQVLEMINGNLYSIVVGATGSGKTTQVPQILLDDAIRRGEGAMCDIICTQPRRIAAISVAERVAVERDEPLRESIGYQVRFDRQLAKPGGSVTFCTTGILLEQLKQNPDEVFKSISHLLIDEVHERDLNIDFLMIILKKAIKARQAAGKPVPKIVLMSATLDTELFSKYFSISDQPGVISRCPSITVPGRTFPVKEMYLGDILSEMKNKYGNQLDRFTTSIKTRDYLEAEKRFTSFNESNSLTKGGESVIDWKRQQQSFERNDSFGAQPDRLESLVPVELVAATLAHICNTTNNGAILVFLPGLPEILLTQQVLEASLVFGVDFMDTRKFKVSILHSTVSKDAQSAVFEPVPPGCRKIILSTNIAETSVTIPDVQFVIDSGKLREKRYDQTRRITKLQCTWVSKSNSKQRAGRAGRVQNGNYYALFSRERYEMLRSIGLPELLRSDLQETCLATKIHSKNDPVDKFLAQAIEPPSPTAVEMAVNSLKDMEAFTQSEELTPLGRLLARLPVHPTLGKMIVLGVIFRCLDPLLILGAAAGERSLLLEPIDMRSAARQSHHSLHAGEKSDHIIILNAFNKLRRVREMQGPQQAWQFGQQSFLHMASFKSITGAAESIIDILVEVGLMPPVLPRERLDFMYGHPDLNKNSHNLALVKCLILAGYHPNLAAQKTSNSAVLRTRKEANLVISQTSINKRVRMAKTHPKEQEEASEKQLYTYSTLHSSTDGSLSIRETTAITPLMAALFGGSLKPVARSSIMQSDQWLPLFVRARDVRGATNLILDFKNALNQIMSHSFQSLSSLDRGSLPDNRVREVVTQGLVDALNMEHSMEFHDPNRFEDFESFQNSNRKPHPDRKVLSQTRRRLFPNLAQTRFAQKYPHLFA